jgi:hypothetical protein
MQWLGVPTFCLVFYSQVIHNVFPLRRWHHIFIAHKVIFIEYDEHLVVGLLEEEASPKDAGRN